MREILNRLEEWMWDDNTFIFLFKCGVLFGLPVVLVIGTLCYISASDPHIMLNKRDWQCTHSHTALVPTVVGKVIISEPREICDTYEMNR